MEVTVITETDGGERVVAVCATPALAEQWVDARLAQPMCTSAFGVKTFPVAEDIMRDAATLEAARRLVTKYLHPSRLGQVPNDELAASMQVTDVMLAWVAAKAREAEGAHRAPSPESVTRVLRARKPPPSSRAGGGHLVDIEEPERTGSPRSVERDLYGEPPGEELPDPEALGAVLGFRPLSPPDPEEPGYHGEGDLADFDPGTGRSGQDDWGKDS